MTSIPKELKYTNEHEWGKKDGEFLYIGITDYAQSALGDIVFVELPEVGTQLSKGDSFGVVESIKSVSDLYSPVAGEVIEVNSELETAPEKCNENPYEAWMVKLKITENNEYESMLSPDNYQQLVDQQ